MLPPVFFGETFKFCLCFTENLETAILLWSDCPRNRLDWNLRSLREVGLSSVPANGTGNQIVTDAAYVEAHFRTGPTVVVQEVIHSSSEKDCQGRQDTNRLK